MLMPARLFQREFIRFVGTQAIVPGGAQVQFDLQRVGYCPGLIVRLSGTHTVATADAGTAARGPYSIIRRFLLQPPGAQPLLNLDGPNLHLHNVYRKDFSPHVPGAVAKNLEYLELANWPESVGPDLVWPTGIGAGQVVNLWWFIPLTRSAFDLRGLLPLGNQTTTTLFVTPGVLADAFTVPGNVTATAYAMTVYQLVLSTPPPRADIAAPDTGYVITYEEQDQVMVAGVNAVNIDPHDTIIRIIHTMVQNGLVDTNNCTAISLRLDESFVLNALDRIAWELVQNARSGQSSRRGVICHDFDHMVDSDGSAPIVLPGERALPFALSISPWVHTEQVATIRSELTCTAAAGTARIFTTVARLARVRG
ncbi:MAG: hypothetical protein DDT21_02417 [Syntrophomonadaceae bacterium]|nr:hypothetical protein [Bacillota bacterium]